MRVQLKITEAPSVEWDEDKSTVTLRGRPDEIRVLDTDEPGEVVVEQVWSRHVVHRLWGTLDRELVADMFAAQFRDGSPPLTLEDIRRLLDGDES